MDIEKKVVDILEINDGQLALTKMAIELGVGYYKFKLEVVPELIQKGVISLKQHKSFTYVTLNQ